MAFSVIAVSIRVSPLRTEEVETDMLMTSAPSRLPASSNEVRVRVDASKNRLMMVWPRSSDCFLSARRFCSTNFSDWSSSSDDLGRRQALDPQQMAVLERGGGCDFAHGPAL